MSVCLYLSMCVCVWELLSLFNRHCNRKQKIYTIYIYMTKINRIVHSKMNILLLFAHLHVVPNLLFFYVEHKRRIFSRKIDIVY